MPAVIMRSEILTVSLILSRSLTRPWIRHAHRTVLSQSRWLRGLGDQPCRSLIGRHDDIPHKTINEIVKRFIDWGFPEYWSGGRCERPKTIRPPPASQSELMPRRMMDSYQEAVIPLQSNHALRERYLTFFNTVRFGRLLEDLDIMAGLIGYTHNLDPQRGVEGLSSIGIVTAAADRINLKTKVIYPDSDIFLRGHVTWVGSSSMEVTLNVEQEQSQKLTTIIEAKLTMVARDTTGRKAFVNPLEIVTPDEKRLHAAGQARKHIRETMVEKSLLRTPPSEEERLLVHDLFLQTLDSEASTFKRPRKPEGSIWMEDSLLKNVIICFPERRNIHNKIFGGFLMRKAFELGWATASVYSQMQPAVVAVDDITFKKPVSIGSLLYLSALVVYTSGPFLQVRVHAEVVDPKTGHKETTNEFRFTYSTIKDTLPSIPKTYAERQSLSPVIPKTYSEFMMYLDGKRQHEITMETRSDQS